ACALDEQDREREREQIRQRRVEASGEREREIHPELARIVHFARYSPPPRDQDPPVERLRPLAPDGRLAIPFEALLLPIRVAEDPEREEEEGAERDPLRRRKDMIRHDEPPPRQAVEERDIHQVPPDEH